MRVRTQIRSGVGLLLLAMSSLAQAVPLMEILESVSKRNGKNFIVDPHVQADVMLAGETVNDITYDDLQEILQVHGFVAVAVGTGNLVKIVPLAGARTMATPLVSGRERHADAEIVSKVIPVKTMPAAHLVPLLRPLLPQHAHLAAVACTNVLIMADTYANIRRMESLVKAVDTGEPYKATDCTASVEKRD